MKRRSPHWLQHVLGVTCGTAVIWFVTGCPFFGLGCPSPIIGFQVSGILVDHSNGLPLAETEISILIENDEFLTVYFGNTTTAGDGSFTAQADTIVDVCFGDPPDPELPSPAFMRILTQPNDDQALFAIDPTMVTEVPDSLFASLDVGRIEVRPRE